MRKRREQIELLPGMPAPFKLTKTMVNGEMVVSWGPRAVFVYDPADLGMRNLAIVALTSAGASGLEVAALFELRPEYISRLRGRASKGGSAALVPPMGRPRLLSDEAIAQAYAMADANRPGTEIAAAISVSTATVSRLLARRVRPESEQLRLSVIDGVEKPDQANIEVESAIVKPDLGNSSDTDNLVVTRISDGIRQSAYAGAMLLHGFFDRVGASAVFGVLPSGSARRYDVSATLLVATFGFALGASSLEGTKHLLDTDAGALVGLERFPHLRTLRPRLAGLAEEIDPLRVQVALAKAMLEADDSAPEVFFVDDHFVAYTGSAPLAKGWNTRRRRGEPGRNDTLIVDENWRAICFSSGAPSSLSKTMWGPLEQLRVICGDRPVMVGFDRGGAYPKVFAELNKAGFDWVTYRRAPLEVPSVLPKHSWVTIDGYRHYIQVASETLHLEDVGALRQISIYEDGQVALQILTSDLVSSAARLAHTLRSRWRIENSFKYLQDHHGIGWLCDYRMDRRPNVAKVTNPMRTQAHNALKSAELAVAELERSIGRNATTQTADIKEKNNTLDSLSRQLEVARVVFEEARVALKAIPAKIPATDIDPNATRAWPVTNRRALQMVCSLLAYNAELDLARTLNNYLCDLNEYRSITRNLLHQPGEIRYSPRAITVTIRQPDAPRINRALSLLIEQLNANPPRLSGDNRPITYQIEPKS
ncbi:putative transposase [Acidithrix sp. C25]|uniref:putative transposase n=1 Tax=Acidithrix sp. C25 TaxID=1671482 RepID=UPI00191B97AB|nr:hypothetical protein [Acidithrix sp. C25]